MSLLDELKNLDEPLHGPKCSVAKILSQLTEAESAALIAVIDDENISATSIARALERAGHNVLGITIRRHRKRGSGDGCRCAR